MNNNKFLNNFGTDRKQKNGEDFKMIYRFQNSSPESKVSSLFSTPRKIQPSFHLV